MHCNQNTTPPDVCISQPQLPSIALSCRHQAGSEAGNEAGLQAGDQAGFRVGVTAQEGTVRP